MADAAARVFDPGGSEVAGRYSEAGQGALGGLSVENETLALWGLDPAAMFRAAGYEPDPIQERYLRDKSQRVAVNNCRQWGKSLTTALIGYNESVCFPNSMTLIFCPAERQSKNVLKYAGRIHQALNQPVPCVSETQTSMVFANGSEMWALPGTEKTTRSFAAVTLLIMDEASRIEDSLYFSVRPMLATSGGRILMPSTPFGGEGFYAETWKGLNAGEYEMPTEHDLRGMARRLGTCERCGFDGDLLRWEQLWYCELCWLDQHFWDWRSSSMEDGWRRYRVLAEDCPRIPDWFLAEERKIMGPYWFRQEYCCQFVASEHTVFDPVALQRSIDPDTETLFDMPGVIDIDVDFRDAAVKTLEEG